MLISSVRKSSIALGIFALVTSGILSATLLGTRDRIAESERQAAEKALLEIVPRERHDNDMLVDSWPVPQAYWETLGLKEGGDIHIARKQGELVAIIVPAVAPDGYSGSIKMIVGINRNGSVAGVRVLSHQETPGLGDRIELKKSDWILSFNDKSLKNPAAGKWNVKKDKGVFDQFTGATITPRAVVKQVRRSLEFFDAAKGELDIATPAVDHQASNEQTLNRHKTGSATEQPESPDSTETTAFNREVADNG